MSDITTCPKCHADLSVSDARGDALVCARCGYTATRPQTLPAGDRDLDVHRRPRRKAHYVVLLLSLAVVLPVLILFALCASVAMWH